MNQIYFLIVLKTILCLQRISSLFKDIDLRKDKDTGLNNKFILTTLFLINLSGQNCLKIFFSPSNIFY